MNVDAPEARRFENRGRQNQAVRGHDQCIEMVLRKCAGFRAHRLRRSDCDAVLSGELFNGRRHDSASASGRPRRLTVDDGDFMVTRAAYAGWSQRTSGVPAKPSRNRGAVASVMESGADAMLFLQLLADALTLQAGDVVDEELAFEMVALVLDADRQHAIRLQFERLAVAVQCAHANLLRAFDEFVESGNRQTALLGLLLTLQDVDLSG